MSVLGALDIAGKALAAASAGIEVTSQNVGNANTLGYSRKTLTTLQSDPLFRDGLWFGQGVDVTGIVRATDRLLGMRLVATAGDEAASSSRLDGLRMAETWFNETTSTGLAEAWDQLFVGLSALTNDPSDPSLRRAVTEAGNSLALTINRTADGLQSTIDGFDSDLGPQIDEVNAMLIEVAALNASIGREGATDGPTDLLDRRDTLVRALAETIGATVDFAADGQATVFIGGHAVVSGPTARTIAFDTDSSGAPLLTVSVGDAEIPVNDDLAGKIGGILDARTITQGWLDDLDAFAYDLGNSINAVHAAGFDAYGNPGGEFFVMPTVVSGTASTFSMNAALLADPDLLALAGTSPSDPGDATNLLALIDYQDAAAFNGGTQDGLSFLSNLLSSVGNEVASAEADYTNQQAVLQDLDAMRTSISGVDTDEEAMKLIEYQSAYRAAAQVITTANEMISTLIGMVG